MSIKWLYENRMNNISITEGDITQAHVDAIVNAANPMMLGGGGVDGAIHEAAGPKLLEACQRVKAIDKIRCPFGEARLTIAGNLLAKYVIHAVGPVYRSEELSKPLLESAYHNSLQLALENDCRSIAFPAISCGAYGYPHATAARIAIQECSRAEYASLEIMFFLMGKKMKAVWQKALTEHITNA